jgi:hypothetical protein
MTIVRGRFIHHNNCTYCQYRQQIPAGTKSKRRELERCALTDQHIPRPFDPDGGQRYCEHYRQKGCACDRCQPTEMTKDTGITVNQLEFSIDK